MPRAIPALLAWLAGAAAAGAAPQGAGAAGEVLDGQPPPPGPYEATLCVAVAAAPPDCGPVAAEVGAAGRVIVRIADILYRFEPWGGELGITMMHGTMQVDGFFAPYQWRGRTLSFHDTDKRTRYELRLGARRFD